MVMKKKENQEDVCTCPFTQSCEQWPSPVSVKLRSPAGGVAVWPPKDRGARRGPSWAAGQGANAPEGHDSGSVFLPAPLHTARSHAGGVTGERPPGDWNSWDSQIRTNYLRSTVGLVVYCGWVLSVPWMRTGLHRQSISSKVSFSKCPFHPGCAVYFQRA